MRYLDDDAHLVLFAVAIANQRRGIGSALLCWLEAAASIAGAQRVRVEARHENAAARCFYNEHGYHEVKLEPGMYRKKLDGIRLEKWLRSTS
jgi:ribosomal-protein-alanine N-acetyltransferase